MAKLRIKSKCMVKLAKNFENLAMQSMVKLHTVAFQLKRAEPECYGPVFAGYSKLEDRSNRQFDFQQEFQSSKGGI
eukprot:scaffold5973_cov42-Prasinocladus_malaysianus.AAC.2